MINLLHSLRQVSNYEHSKAEGEIMKMQSQYSKVMGKYQQYGDAIYFDTIAVTIVRMRAFKCQQQRGKGHDRAMLHKLAD